ncbi:MAG: hypothetical protein M0Q53_19405 [Prolixibacteraceae bacterium]|nr:hypothetical protein [Prolixibacteraceae bacterium]MCK9639801.1 hypothetical protein [Prolixibacteraceae bacterium]
MVTKRLENTKESASIGKIPAGWLKELFNGREVNSYKTLEHINDMFKKKNNPKTPK